MGNNFNNRTIRLLKHKKNFEYQNGFRLEPSPPLNSRHPSPPPKQLNIIIFELPFSYFLLTINLTKDPYKPIFISLTIQNKKKT